MTITYNGKTYTYDEWHQEIVRQAEEGEKWCYNCVHHRKGTFISFTEHYCDLHGYIGVGSKIDSDEFANICPNYVQKEGKRWFE